MNRKYASQHCLTNVPPRFIEDRCCAPATTVATLQYAVPGTSSDPIPLSPDETYE